MTTKHTPGPWAIGTTIAGGCDILAGQIGERIVVARATDNSLLPLDECAANARLIAAAPDLLAALEDISSAKASDDAFDPFKAAERFQAIARDATAKARGE